MKKNQSFNRINFKCFCLSLLFFTICGFSSFSQTAKEIINNHIKAIGGKAKLDAINTFSFEMGSKTIYFKKPDMWRIVNVDSGKIISTTIYNGENGWNIFKQDNVQRSYTSLSLSGNSDNIFLISYLAYANTKDYKIEYRGLDEKSGNYILQVTPLKNNSIDARYSYYLDPKTYLVNKSTIEFSNDVDFYYKDYKLINGIMIPLTINEDSGFKRDAANEVRTKIKTNIPLNNNLFADPTLKNK